MRLVTLLTLLATDAGMLTERTVDCTYSGFCCQFDFIGKSGCRLRLFCRGHRTERVDAQGRVVSATACK